MHLWGPICYVQSQTSIEFWGALPYGRITKQETYAPLYVYTRAFGALRSLMVPSFYIAEHCQCSRAARCTQD